MFVAAAGGASVAKHGGRSVSSSSGSADVLDALGAAINLPPPQVARCIEQTGIGFMFAPNHHAAMKHAAPVRKELGIRTIFNILGPLTNPAQAKRQLIGVFHRDLVGIQVRVLQRLGSEHVMVVHGENGMDELSLEGPSFVGELVDGQVNEYVVSPEDVGLIRQSHQQLTAKSAAESKEKIIQALENKPGAVRDIVLLNAGAALYVAGQVTTLIQGVDLARSVVESGAALSRLEQFVKATQALALEATK
jgi:anthranilate phosphoribosyltransferase